MIELDALVKSLNFNKKKFCISFTYSIFKKLLHKLQKKNKKYLKKII